MVSLDHSSVIFCLFGCTAAEFLTIEQMHFTREVFMSFTTTSNNVSKN